jgi:sugar phosphate isomerase/epimerase
MEPLHIHVPYTALNDHFDLIRQRRYDLEIYVSASALDQITKPDIEGLMERLDWTPALTLHAPFLDLNPGALDPMVKSATQARFRQFLNVAAVFKPRAAVFHAAYDKWRYNGHLDNWLKNSVDTWRTVMDTASKIGLRVAIENVFDENPDALQMLMEKINSQDFGFCFDTGHFNLFTTVPMERWFDSLGRRLVEVHLHDNNGTEDSHWALGRGKIDFEKFFSLMSSTARFPVLTIEAHDKDDIETSLDRVKSFVKKHYRLPCV